MDHHEFLIAIVLVLAALSPLHAANSRNSSAAAKNWSKSFDATFPEHLRRGFKSCSAAATAAPGESGVCKLLAAMDEQLKILSSSTSPPPPGPDRSPSSSCKFKLQGGQSLHRYATDRSPALESLLEHYSAMHSACVARDHHHLRQVITKNTKPSSSAAGGAATHCRYIVWSCSFGLGNKLMSLVSTFLYALLSQRVLLLEEPSWDRLFCEPFRESRWILPPDLSLKDDQSVSFPEFYSRHSHRRRSAATPAATIVPIVFSADTKAEEHRFLVCPAATSSVRDVPVLNFRNSNQYFAPGFMLNPALRPVLEAIFPERRIFHNLASFLLGPADEVWAAIQTLHAAAFRGAARRIAVQLRESKGEYRDYYDASVPRCIRSKSGICPIEVEEFRESRKASGDVAGGDGGDVFAVFIASLVGQHAARLNASLRGLEAETGQRFELASQGADEEQRDDVDHQKKALVDIWALSTADVLLTSHMSTFGYTAVGGVDASHGRMTPAGPACRVTRASTSHRGRSWRVARMGLRWGGGIRGQSAGWLARTCRTRECSWLSLEIFLIR